MVGEGDTCQLSVSCQRQWPNLWNSPLTATNTVLLIKTIPATGPTVWVESCQNRYSGSGLFNLIQIHIEGISRAQPMQVLESLWNRLDEPLFCDSFTF